MWSIYFWFVLVFGLFWCLVVNCLLRFWFWCHFLVVLFVIYSRGYFCYFVFVVLYSLLFYVFFIVYYAGEVFMSYANMDGVPTQTAGTSELLASDWNTYVRDNFDSIKFGHIVCTSSTRPTGIAEGTMIYETDTNKVLVYDGSAWRPTGNVDIATSSTRPGTTFEGQVVYETDTQKTMIYNGASWVEVLDLDTPPSMVFLGATSGSNVASLTLDNVFSSSFKYYRVLFTVSPASANAYMYWRFRDAGSDETASSYSWCGYGLDNSGAGGMSQYDLAAQANEANFYTGDSTNANQYKMDMSLYVDGTLTKRYTANVGYNRNGGRPSFVTGGGYYSPSPVTSVDGIKVYASTGNIYGLIRVYGLRDAL